MMTPTQIVYITGEVLVAAISIVGNCLVLAAIVKNQRLHTVTNVFIASLATADTVVGFLVVPCATLSFLGLPQDFYGCVFINSVILMFTNVSILMLMSVAIERFLAIKEPFVYQRLLTTKRAVYFNVVVWIAGAILGLVPLYGWHKDYQAVKFCAFTGVIPYEYLVYFQFIGLVLVPLFIMLCIYIYILIIVRRHMRKTNALQNLFRENNQTREGFSKDVKAAKMFALVILLFGIFWLPINIFNCLSLFCSKDCPFPLEALLAAIVMSHANSGINPFLYAASNSRIKRGIKSLFGIRFAQDDRSSTEHNQARTTNGATKVNTHGVRIHEDGISRDNSAARPFTVNHEDFTITTAKKNVVVPINDPNDRFMNRNFTPVHIESDNHSAQQVTQQDPAEDQLHISGNNLSSLHGNNDSVYSSQQDCAQHQHISHQKHVGQIIHVESNAVEKDNCRNGHTQSNPVEEDNNARTQSNPVGEDNCMQTISNVEQNNCINADKHSENVSTASSSSPYHQHQQHLHPSASASAAPLVQIRDPSGDLIDSSPDTTSVHNAAESHLASSLHWAPQDTEIMSNDDLSVDKSNVPNGNSAHPNVSERTHIVHRPKVSFKRRLRGSISSDTTSSSVSYPQTSSSVELELLDLCEGDSRKQIESGISVSQKVSDRIHWQQNQQSSAPCHYGLANSLTTEHTKL